jgi:hypothetical protein
MGSRKEPLAPNPPLARPQERSSEKWRNFAIVLIGLVLVFLAEPFLQWINLHLSDKPRLHDLAKALDYGAEHLGVVFVVAIFVRVIIERASEREFLKLINVEVKNQIEKTSEDISSQSLTPLRTSIDDVKRQVNTSLQEITTESLKPLRGTVENLDKELSFRIRRPGLLDDESRLVLERKVLNPSFIRPKYDLILTLEPLSDNSHPDLFKVRASTSYTVKNITKESASYQVKAWVDTIYEPPDISARDASQFTFFVCGPEEKKAECDLRPFLIEDLRRLNKIERVEGGLWLRYDLLIPEDKTYYVNVEATQLNRTTDLFVWNVIALTKTLTVTVKFAGGLNARDFQVNARELHHVEHDTFRETRKEDADSISWSIDQVILPYQGIEVWWSPLPSSAKS